MRRVIVTALVLAAAGGFAVLAGGAKDEGGPPKYWIELDNAFGLIEGADFKVAGVRAGKITKMKLERRKKRALVEFQIDQKKSFTELRSDVYCETRPQSLIGEYFIDCNPGKTGRKLERGSTIPVSHTASTIPADLVNNILRLPERERLRIILNEFGTGLAARGGDLNSAIRRGVPALRETDRLLAILAAQNRVIGNLTRDADTVITALANNKENVGRFVVEARDTAAASAERQADIAGSFRRLPTFLAELTPTMRELGRVADGQRLALQDLNASAGQLTRFFRNLGPFAEASRPSIRTLGEASVVGSQAVRAGRPNVAELRRATTQMPELGKNLAIVLEDLYDRDRAVEKDERAPGENTGWNGLEAILGYVFWQSQAINIFDRNTNILKVAVYDERDCSPYRDAAWWRSHPEERQHCASQLGPNQPGLTAPDTSNPPGTVGRNDAAALRAQEAGQDAKVLEGSTQAAGPAPSQDGGSGGGGAQPNSGGLPRPPIDIGRTIDSILGGGGGPQVPLPGGGPVPQNLPQVPNVPRSETNSQLLDYLLGS